MRAEFLTDEVPEDDNSQKLSGLFRATMKIAKAKVAHSHLQLLVELMDTHLKHMTTLREEIRTTEISKIHFEDLWHLFSPGDVVLMRESEQSEYVQALRILRITGGRRCLNSNSTTDKGATDKSNRPFSEIFRPEVQFSSLKINCYHMDFDGSDFGPVPRNIIIDRYPGERPIISLPVYPLSFHEQPSFRSELSDGTQISYIKNVLLKRGRKFSALCPGPQEVCHKQYTGWSLDAIPDLVCGWELYGL